MVEEENKENFFLFLSGIYVGKNSSFTKPARKTSHLFLKLKNEFNKKAKATEFTWNLPLLPNL
jgi:hypothetical protein